VGEEEDGGCCWGVRRWTEGMGIMVVAWTDGGQSGDVKFAEMCKYVELQAFFLIRKKEDTIRGNEGEQGK